MANNNNQSFNKSTIFSHFSFHPNGWYVDRPNVCLQKNNNSSYDVVYPLEHPNRKNLQLPYPFKFDKAFLKSLEDRNLRKRDLTLIIVFSVLGLLLCVGVGILLFFRKKYHWIFIDRSSVSGGEEWGSAT